MEDFIFLMHTFPTGNVGGSRAYTMFEHDAIEAFNLTNDDCNADHAELAARGVFVVTMLIRARDRELIAHREWKPADPNQPELPL